MTHEVHGNQSEMTSDSGFRTKNTGHKDKRRMFVPDKSPVCPSFPDPSKSSLDSWCFLSLFGFVWHLECVSNVHFPCSPLIPVHPFQRVDVMEAWHQWSIFGNTSKRGSDLSLGLHRQKLSVTDWLTIWCFSFYPSLPVLSCLLVLCLWYHIVISAFHSLLLTFPVAGSGRWIMYQEKRRMSFMAYEGDRVI